MLRAQYNDNGDIILPGGEEPSLPSNQHVVLSMHAKEWEVWEDLPQADPAAGMPKTEDTRREEVRVELSRETYLEMTATFRRSVSTMRTALHRTVSDVVSEGWSQYGASTTGFLHGIKNMRSSCKAALLRLWEILRQPVWVPSMRNTPKQYSRGTLFALDIARFGVTFAGIFGLLFVALNYQSFWEILRSRLDPYADSEFAQDIGGELDPLLREKLLSISSASAGGKENDLLSHLPLVGPPEKRLIIPKLGLNVPIILPPNTALLQENWAQLEEDIQSALQGGVVHYPGTARPGQAGNFFITGHSSYYPFLPGLYKSVFARLHQLNTGDEYWVYYGGDKHRYRVKEKQEVSPSDVRVLDQPAGQRLSTLMTCTPVGTTLRRLVVVAEEIDPISGKPLSVGEHATQQQMPKVRVESLPI